MDCHAVACKAGHDANGITSLRGASVRVTWRSTNDNDVDCFTIVRKDGGVVIRNTKETYHRLCKSLHRNGMTWQSMATNNHQSCLVLKPKYRKNLLKRGGSKD